MSNNEKPSEIVFAVATEAAADIYVLSGAINSRSADELISCVRVCEKRRPNAILALTTDGGSADAAYRIARTLKRHHKRLILLVFGECYSAGTLVAVAADEIVMSEFGQLGPLDVQLADKSEFFGQTPALDVSQALAFLSETAFDFFTSHFVGMGPGRRINTQTASDIAKTLTLGIIEPIAKQIDPLLLGRVDRSMKIAEAYSERLKPGFKSIKKLVQGKRLVNPIWRMAPGFGKS
jgi:membrane-bound ClpP family serine protease